MYGGQGQVLIDRKRVAMRGTALLVLGLASLLAALAPPAGAAGKPRAAKIEIVSPKPDARTAKRLLVVRVESSTRAGFRASVDGRVVSKRFKPQGGGVLTGRLRLGRDFVRGANNLLVGAGRGVHRRAVTVRFFAHRRSGGLLTVSKHRERSVRTPLRLRLRVKQPVSRLRLTLNGKRVRIGSAAGRHAWTVPLGADDGLRFGRNSATVEAHAADGRGFDRERLRFAVSRRAPLVGAGPGRRTEPGRPVVLDGSSTRAGAGGAPLAYRWQIVEKPRGSRARIAKGSAKTARLRPDVAGIYKLRLLAAPAAAVRGKASASASAESPQQLLPAAPRTLVGADEVTVNALATEDPMGWTIQTIAADGSIRVGPQTFAKKPGWARLMVLGQQSLRPVNGSEGQVFSLREAGKLASAVEATKNTQVVVISGMGQAQSSAPKAATEALAKAVSLLGGEAPPSSERAGIVRSGEWSVIGTKGEPGRTFTNLYGLTGQSPVEVSSTATLPGSLNGYMQNVLVNAFRFVSPEYVPIDTRAEGSSNTVSVFEVGDQKLTSATIGNGSLALHLAVFDATAEDGELTPLENATFVIDDPYSQTDFNGVKAAAEALEKWRKAEEPNLIVLQTFGEGAVGPNTAPWASQYWVNDALIHPNSRGLYEWNGQPYLKAKRESEIETLLDRMWNPGYPTVAGQVGDLTGQAGHDLVANLGAGNPGVEVTRLAMVANNRTEDPEANFVEGYPGPAEGQVAGLLVRNPESGWKVEAAVPSAAFRPDATRKIAYQARTAWPQSQTAEQKKAMIWIAERVTGVTTTNVREHYVDGKASDWLTKRNTLLELGYHQTDEFTKATFEALQRQLAIEMNDVATVKGRIQGWQEIFTSSSYAGFVNVSSIVSKIVERAEKEAKLNKRAEAEVSPEAIISESLYTAADLLGFPEATEELKLVEAVGVAAGGFGLAEAAQTEQPEEQERADSAAIRAQAGELATALAKHFELTADQLGHLGAIYVSDWGKLKAASKESAGPWVYGGKAEEIFQQSLAVTTSQQIWQGLLPLVYDQWVISPYVTVSNPSGPEPPGGKYSCKEYRPAYESETYRHPFASEPEGALSTSIYRPFNEPGSSAPPAQRYTTPYTLRALKSREDELRLRKVEYVENRYGITVSHDGSSPPKSFVDPLFEAVNPGEEAPGFPVALGMSKVEFFAEYGEGPTEWRRMICAEE